MSRVLCSFDLFLQPLLTKIGILDTCGVHNLHGMPGVFSGLLSVLFAALASQNEYGTDELGVVFEAMKNVRDFSMHFLLILVSILLMSGIITVPFVVAKLRCVRYSRRKFGSVCISLSSVCGGM